MTVYTKEDLKTSELIEKLVNQRRSFAITSISQKKDSEPNYIALIQNFKDELREGDFEYSEFTGKWIEDGKYVEKTSLLWADINERQACKLGNHYKRCSIFYKDVKEIREICTYPFLKGDKEYKFGDIIRTLPINFKIPLNMEFVKTIFAERNISNELKDFSDDEKEILSDEFAEKYEGKVLEFIDFISDKSVSVEGTYKETWKYIEKDKNSLERHSNMHLIFKTD